MIQIVKKIRVNHYDIDPDVIVAGTRGSYGIVKLVFDFDSSWDGLTKKIVFHPIRGRPIEVPLLDVPIDIPVEVMEHSGETGYVISGYAAGEEQALLSLPGTIKVLFTLDDEGGNSAGMTPDTYLLFLEQAVLYLNKILADAKASGAFKGEDGEKGDPFEYEDFTPEQLENLRGPEGKSGVYVSKTEYDTPKNDENVWIIDGGNADDDEDILIPDGFTYADNMLQLMCGDVPVGDPIEVISGGGNAVSPTVTLTPIQDGTQMSVTDADGTQTFVIKNGKNFKILGYYNTVSALQNAVPNPEVGDAYGIGTSEPYDVYVFDGISHKWINNGSLAGVAGADGKDGITFTPHLSDDSVLSWTNNGGLPNPQPVSIKGKDGVSVVNVEQTYTSNEDGGYNIITVTLSSGDQFTFVVKNGERGKDGDDGSDASITIDTQMSDTSTNAVQNKVIVEYINSVIGDVESAIDEINNILGGA